MNAVPGFEIEISPNQNYSVEVNGVVVARFTATAPRAVGLAARGMGTMFIHEDGRPIDRMAQFRIQRASSRWPHAPSGDALTAAFEDILEGTPNGRFLLTCGASRFDLWLGPVAD